MITEYKLLRPAGIAHLQHVSFLGGRTPVRLQLYSQAQNVCGNSASLNRVVPFGFAIDEGSAILSTWRVKSRR